MACEITVKPVDGPKASWTCTWDIINHTSTPTQPWFQCVDLRFDVLSGPMRPDLSVMNGPVFIKASNGWTRELLPSDFKCSAPFASFQFLLDCLASTISNGKWVSRRVNLVAPRTSGNIVRSDIIPLRMVDMECVKEVRSLATPLEHFSGRPLDASADLLTLVSECAGGIILETAPNEQIADLMLQNVQLELHNRLSFPWVVPGLQRKTIAILEGSTVHPSRGGTAENIYGAAKALGIDVVVLAVQGHWLEGPEYAHWRKAFVPIKFGFDAEFPARIVSAVKQSGVEVDGLFTIFDCFQMAISAAAEELGFPAEPASAFEIATNKYKMSAFEGHEAFRAASADEALNIAATQTLPYPIIVKPCNGWGSEDVFKVDDAADLARQVGRINTDRHGAEFVMEHYCDGPEIDVNIVLYDGEILFSEIGDEYPKGAENGTQDDFHELDTCSPSQLPVDEQTTLRSHFHQTLLRLGFRNGIFHCEARMQDSSVEWKAIDSGMYELQHSFKPAAAPPSVWVIEVNPRPPGMKATGIVETTYGVDYWALTMLMALRDSTRVHSLSQQFRNGAQYHADMVFFSATFDDSKEGIWKSGDVTTELLERKPELAKNVSRSMTFIKNGDKVPKPSSGVNTFVAYMNIFSRKSRREVLEIAKALRQEIQIEYL
ncbi:ATP-grasp domain-domain-containing protein [Clohesyomyces aquaticus]|uniref:ATP-grasp domain-domain-containing protein n=1 Tax=Clohesyomyces aquaticus TaxID=1231657 RepID=A0A1Y1Z8H7_9PLEO|nr:ATP-grasp domain-domain-containing protein [Clohesyomyces aquaticus]